MSTTYTTSNLATAVLREMAVIAADESPSSDDSTYVTDVYAAKYAELSAHGLELTYWASDAIPAAVFLTLRDLMITEVCGAFGLPMSPEDKDQRQTVILKRLRRHTATQKSGNVIMGEYF